MTQLKRFLAPVAALIILASVVVVINQTAQLVELTSTLDPTLGRVLLIVLIALYVGLLAVPLVLVLRLPRPLSPPDVDHGPEFEAHLSALSRRLRVNPLLADSRARLTNREEIEEGLRVLDDEANRLIRAAASTVFLTTAVSQSGRLDFLMVLTAQSRLVWQVARVYEQRPDSREMAQLYANVAATALVAGELDDSEVGDQIGAILAGSLGSLAAAVPGFQSVTSVMVNSILTGAANAFLTLRVGIIARNYCDALVVPDRRTLRRAASAQAIRMLGSIVGRGTKTISTGLWELSKGKAKGAVTTIRDKFSSGGEDQLDEDTLSSRFFEKLRW